jgi:hypothetical protein
MLKEVDERANGADDSNECDAPARDAQVIDMRRSRLGLRALPPEGRVVVEAAIAAQTPAGVRVQNLLAIGAEIDAQAVSNDNFDMWVTVCQRLDAIAYAVRLVEAQLIAGNTGEGMLLPDRDLLA